MKNILSKLGIHSFNDFIGTIGGILILLLFLEGIVFIWVDKIPSYLIFKTFATTLIFLALCGLLYENKD